MSTKTQRIVCPFCGGDGRSADEKCEVCHGDGQVEAIARDDAERLRAFFAAYDAWATSEEHCAGPLFEGLIEARAALEAPKPPEPEHCACGATWTPLHACHGARP